MSEDGRAEPGAGAPTPTLSAAFSGRYRIRELLGRGGMGTVFRATQLATDRDVAIKFMSSSLFEGDDTETRFLNEAKTLASLDHPNLVKVVEAGKDGSLPYIVFEYVPGSTLKQEIEAKGRMPVAEALRVIHETLLGLKEAHARDIVHRDVKSENVLLDASRRAKVIDFGIAKSEGARQTKTGVIVGTPAYMAPEQAMGKKLDARTDVYAAGIVLFETLTGRLPFGDENSMATMMAHINDPCPTASSLVEGLPTALDDLLAGALAKQPEARYPNAGAFAIAVDRTAKKLQQVGYREGPISRTSPTQKNNAPERGGTRAQHLATTTGAGAGGGASATRAASLAIPLATGGSSRPGPTAGVAASMVLQPPPSAPDRSLLPVIGALALALVGGAGWFATRPDAKPPPDKGALGDPAAVEARVRQTLEQIGDPEIDPEVRRVQLRHGLPGAVPGSARELAADVCRELKQRREAGLVPDLDFYHLVALASLGDQGSYPGLLEAAAETPPGRERAYALEALAQGMDRGAFPADDAVEPLARSLWRLDASAALQGDEQKVFVRAFFRAAGALGGAFTVGQIKALRTQGGIAAQPPAVLEGSRQALQSILVLRRPGSSEAHAALTETAGGQAGAMEMKDEELLDAIRADAEHYAPR